MPRGRVLFPRAKCVVLGKVVGQVWRVLFLACVLGRFRGECGKFLRGLVKGSKKKCKQRKLNQISRRSGFCTVISKRAFVTRGRHFHTRPEPHTNAGALNVTKVVWILSLDLSKAFDQKH